jgi:excisionase family DNA binding protein
MDSLLAYSIAEACAVARIGRSTLYKHVRAGNLRAIKIGRRTFFLRGDIDRWLEKMPVVTPQGRVRSETASGPSAIVHDGSGALPPPDG